MVNSRMMMVVNCGCFSKNYKLVNSLSFLRLTDVLFAFDLFSFVYVASFITDMLYWAVVFTGPT